MFERAERYNRVEPVAEFRREHAFDLGHFVAGLALGGKPMVVFWIAS